MRGRLRPGQIRDTFVKYRVQWEGVSDKTWELAPDIVPKAYDLVVAFHSRYPSKPRPECCTAKEQTVTVRHWYVGREALGQDMRVDGVATG